MGMVTGAVTSAITSTSRTPTMSTPSTSNTPTPTSSKRRRSLVDSSPPPLNRSSPPPAIEDELSQCLERFGKRRKISDSLVAQAKGQLATHGYFPDALAGLEVQRIQELTGLDEGSSEGLKRYAESYSQKIEGKRERRNL
ncbi:hypothetical protein PM082_007327 [Marasmius tenuissimus]|nr:hypothetical protein PM082_007327 [Marasmius tenuissimus]